MLWRRGKSLAPPGKRTLIASVAHKMHHGHVTTWSLSTTTWSDIHAGTTHLHTLDYPKPICNTVRADRCQTIREYLHWPWHVVAQLVKALRYKLGDHEFDSWRCGTLHWHNPSGHIMTLGSTQPLTEMSTRNISCGVKAAGAWGWQPYHLHVQTVLKSGSLNPLEPSGPVIGLYRDWIPLPILN